MSDTEFKPHGSEGAAARGQTGTDREGDFRRYLPGSDYEAGAPTLAPELHGEMRQARPDAAAPARAAPPAAVTSHPAVAPGGEQGWEQQALLDGDAPRRRSRSARGFAVTFMNFFITAFVLGALVVGGILYLGKAQYEAPGSLQEEAAIVVEPGDNFGSITPALVEKGIIPPQRLVNLLALGARVTGKSGQLKTGEFAFKPGVSMADVVRELTEGTPVVHKAVFPEGWTVWRMWERLVALRSQGLLVGELPEMPAEGALLPATYPFTRGTKAADIVAQMKRERDRAVARIWESRDQNLPIASPEELVTLASIVEKETGVAGERARIAGVFMNRLRKGMRLQSDPTIIYGIWGGQGKPKDRGGLRRSEISRRTAYNTYRINGLPPGPIANPGVEALRAVANPADTDDLYFVADGSGGHAFAKTLREHNRNVAEWRKIERANTN